MAEMEASLDRFAEVEPGDAFTVPESRLLKVELPATGVLANNGSMVAYQADVHFDVMAVYDKPDRRLQLAATVAAELAPTPETPRPPRGSGGNLP
jgi:hypothetical protein